MPRRPRLAPHVLFGLALPFLIAGAGDDVNWKRLQSMPREQRLILAEKIREFDILDREVQARIREIDRKIAALPQADQVSYRSVLRRYHIWLQSLPEDQRATIESASGDGKLAAVARLRTAPRRNIDQGRSPLAFQLADVQGRSPFELAQILDIWFKISPEQRDEINNLGARDRLVRLFQLARQARIAPPAAGLTESQVAETLRDLEKDAQTKGLVRAHLMKKAEAKEFFIEQQRRRMAANYYFIANPPKPVSRANLLRFESAMPSWFRSMFDHLPPEEARRRLTVVYRLMYPAPQEIPAAGPFKQKAPGPAKSEPVRTVPGGRTPAAGSPPL